MIPPTLQNVLKAYEPTNPSSTKEKLIISSYQTQVAPILERKNKISQRERCKKSMMIHKENLLIRLKLLDIENRNSFGQIRY